ncbi:hypothetical protein ACCI36_001925, partial [Vibrio parahaemolyticus]
ILNLYNLSATSTDLRLDGNFANTRPVMTAEVMAFSSGEKYKATIESISGGVVVIQIFDVNAPTVPINPSSVDNFTSIQIMGFSTL